MNRDERETVLTLEVLEAVRNDQTLTQRNLARQMGVALGLANSYLKHCVRKGWIKVQTVSPNRYLYFLTPKGCAEKSRLTARYLARSLAFYRTASESCEGVLSACLRQGRRSVVLCGLSELAEIAMVRAQEFDMPVLGVFDAHSDRSAFVHRPVWRDIGDLPQADVFLVTDLNDHSRLVRLLVEAVGQASIAVPDILDGRCGGLPTMDGNANGGAPTAAVDAAEPDRLT
ncbi:MAG TPA: winged helix-turn-helix transcriptional regulator [Gammaproteobacteria bacterium]|nr:winged helix-turn-helix transcriptional regulator [Gammaproteobacteria bacterium]